MPRKFYDISIDRKTGVITRRELDVEDGVDPREVLQHAIDNCPECQALRAAGEVPIIQQGHARPRHRIFTKRPRWRTRKHR